MQRLITTFSIAAALLGLPVRAAEPFTGELLVTGENVGELKEKALPDEWLYAGGLLPPEGVEPIASLRMVYKG